MADEEIPVTEKVEYEPANFWNKKDYEHYIDKDKETLPQFIEKLSRKRFGKPLTLFINQDVNSKTTTVMTSTNKKWRSTWRFLDDSLIDEIVFDKRSKCYPYVRFQIGKGLSVCAFIFKSTKGLKFVLDGIIE